MRRHPPARRLSIRSVAVVLVTVAIGACSAKDPPAAAPDDPGVSHVHGLGVDPADGSLFAATHYGLFSIPTTGQATRVADRFQDTMAFTVVGANHFLAGGHPDLQDKDLHAAGKPPHLGLVESRDAGVTWKSRSLLGEADFHSIAVGPSGIYAYDATGDRLMVSADNGRTWDARATGIAVASLAASPSTPDVLVAVVAGAVAVSRNGGRSFEPWPDAPTSVLVEWPVDGALWSVDAGGQIFRADAPGSSWTSAGRAPGPVEALVVTPKVLAVAVADQDGRTTIYSSSPKTIDWKLRYQDRAQG